MEYKIILRRAGILILCSGLWTVMILATLIFSLQYVLDGIGLRYTVQAYATVGTVYKTASSNPAYTPIDKEVLNSLFQSEAISNIDIRRTQTARLPGIHNVPSYFAVPQTNHLLFFRGTITQCDSTMELDTSFAQYATVRVEEVYAGQSNWIQPGDEVITILVSDHSDRCVDVDNSYGFIAQSAYADSFGKLDRFLYVYNLSPEYIETVPQFQEHRALYENTILPLPDGISDTETDIYVKTLLEEQGLESYMEMIPPLDDVYTVHRTQDMQMLLPVVNEIMFFPEGRGLRPDDVGDCVCVISRELAQLHNFKVGDTLSISLGEDCYTVQGYESGVPALGEPLTQSYGIPKDYRIVGIYAFSTFDPGEATLLFGYNDIFLPADDLTVPDAVYPYNISFQVPGIQYDLFMDETSTELYEQGYTVQMSESKWDSVASTYAEMDNQREMSLFVSVLTIGLCPILFVFLILILYRREFAIRELFGGPFHHTFLAYAVPFSVTSVIAATIGFGFSFWGYRQKLLPRAEAIAPGNFPSDTQIVVLLFVLIFLQIGIAYLLLVIAAKRERNHSILRLLK